MNNAVLTTATSAMVVTSSRLRRRASWSSQRAGRCCGGRRVPDRHSAAVIVGRAEGRDRICHASLSSFIRRPLLPRLRSGCARLASRRSAPELAHRRVRRDAETFVQTAGHSQVASSKSGLIAVRCDRVEGDEHSAGVGPDALMRELDGGVMGSPDRVPVVGGDHRQVVPEGEQHAAVHTPGPQLVGYVFSIAQRYARVQVVGDELREP